MLERSPEPICIAQQEALVYLNPAALGLFGAGSDDPLLGRSLLERIDPPHQADTEQRLAQLCATQETPELYRETWRRLDGGALMVEVRTIPWEYDGRHAALFYLRDISERCENQCSIRRDQQLLSAILEHSSAVIFAKDLNGHYLLANAALSELIDTPIDRILGKRDSELFPAEIAQELARRDRRTVKEGHASEVEERILLNGVEKTYITAKFPLRDHDGSIFGVGGIATDITARKQAEERIHQLNTTLEQRVASRTRELAEARESLRHSLKLNESILDASAAAILAFREDGQCILANPAAVRMTGGTEQQLLDQNFNQVQSWVDSGLLAAARRVLAAHTTETFERRFTTSFNTSLWAELHLSSFDIDGKRHLLLMMQDITDKRLAEELMANREQAFRTLTTNLPDTVIRFDTQGEVLYANPAMERLLPNRLTRSANGEQDPALSAGSFTLLQEQARRIATGGKSTEIDMVFADREENRRHYAMRIVPEPGPDGTPISVLAVGRDLTELKRAEEDLRLAASVFHSSAEGVIITDACGRIISVNPAFSEITGYSAAEALGNKPSMLKSDHQQPEFYRAMWNQLLTEGQWQGELWNRRKGGQVYLEWLTINRIDDSLGDPVRYVAVFHDITEIRRKDEHIHHLAFHDALTGLPNRELLMERLSQALGRSFREAQRLSITFIDLDRFKGINDALGHDVGDNLLQQVGDRIRRCLRSTDTVARVGGDEFLVLMENLSSARDCATKAQQLLDEIARPITLPGYKLEISASMGMAFYPEDSDKPLELMKRADMAMYAAKEAGGNTYRFFRQEMLERTTRRLTLEIDLRRAIANNELELHYQPKIDLSSRVMTGVEALLRWRHPVHGMQPPGEFIPLAEENSLICDIGAWVIEEACRQSARWRDRGLEFRIAVNISPRQLESGDLFQQLCSLARHYGTTPAHLELELTESSLMENPEGVTGQLNQFRQAGVRIAVDDFGTGYSSLAYLRRLPIDILKIDRSFVSDAIVDEDDAQIIKTILALGQSLKLAVVAEGVESTSQAELLQSLGCDQVQGYLYARPMPASELETWLLEHQESPIS
nr:EAL domain-containing protein [Marinobacterium ramblicola]